MLNRESRIKKFITQARPLYHFIDAVKTELDQRGEFPEFPVTSLPNFSKRIWGLRKGLTIIGARASIGKSALALQIAWDLAKQGKKVLFLSLEMSVTAMTERLFCSEFSIDNFEILSGKRVKYDEEWCRFKEMLLNIPLILTCDIGKTVDELEELVDNFDERPDVIIVDYIQAADRSGNEREKLDGYILRFRSMCIMSNIVGILCSQANRLTFQEESKEPTLANLKGTGCLEEHADTVLLLHWPYFYNNQRPESEYKIIIAKQRNGKTGHYDLDFIAKHFRFEDRVEKTVGEVGMNSQLLKGGGDAY